MTVHESQESSLHDVLQQFVAAVDATPSDGELVAQQARRAVGALLAHVESLEAELATLGVEQQRLVAAERQLTDAEQLVGVERELTLEIDNLRRRNEELTGLLDRVYRSASWKVTSPIRKAAAMARETAVDAVREFRTK
jgi:hypothetical protein